MHMIVPNGHILAVFILVAEATVVAAIKSMSNYTLTSSGKLLNQANAVEKAKELSLSLASASSVKQLNQASSAEKLKELSLSGASKNPQDYALLVDAGSSGTRLGMYILKGNDQIDELKPKKGSEKNFEAPRIQEIVGKHGTSAREAFERMCSAALEYVPPKTKIWVKATAGMRKVPLLEANEIYSTAASLIGYGNPKCPFQLEYNGTISGEEEALFTYMTVNSRKGTIGKDALATHGILEMGGASLQAIYRTQRDIMANKVSYYVGKELKSVCATSFSVGSDAAEEAYRKVLVKGKTGSDIDSPCLLVGDERTVEVEGKTYNFKGTGNPDECENYIHQTLHTDYVCAREPCPLMGIHMTRINEQQKFVGTATFYTAMFQLHMAKDKEVTVTPADIHAKATAFCRKTKASWDKDPPQGKFMEWEYQRQACFRGLLVYKVLQAFQFHDDSKQITFGMYDWKLGSLLYDLVYMPKFRIEQNLKTGMPEDDDVLKSSVRALARRRPWTLVLLVVLVLCWGACHFAVGLRVGASNSDKLPECLGGDRMIDQGVDAA